MSKKRIRSRIHEFFTPSLLEELYKICRSNRIGDNNLKVPVILETLTKFGIDFVELGPGTNRLAVLIDNYVFKIAMDKWGMQDNINEFTVTQELQPYVVKTYETNELISVCEYVTVISRDEFEKNKDTIRGILSILAESYLLGDVGAVNKNFANWGYRDNGDLVILDFAYIYRVNGDELLCSQDQSILEYDENFYNMKCPTCFKKYTFMDVRRKITMEHEKNENMLAKQLAYKLNKPVQEFDDRYQDGEESTGRFSSSSYKTNNNDNSKEENKMKEREDYQVSEEEKEDSYLESLELMKNLKAPLDDMVLGVDLAKGQDFTAAPNTKTDMIEVRKETANEKTQIRIFKQTDCEVGDTDGDYPIEDAKHILEEASEDLKGVEDSIPDAEEIENVVSSPDGETTIIIEDGHVVGPVSNEVMEEVFQSPVDESSNEDDTEEVEVTDVDEEEDMYMSAIASDTQTNVMPVDTDGDGQADAIYVQQETQTLIPLEMREEDEDEDEELSDEDNMYQNIMENAESEVVHEGEVIDVVDEQQEEEVVYTNTVKVSDTISVENKVTIKSNETDADKLRQQLSADLVEDIDEDRIDDLAKDYEHLQEEAADDQYRKGPKNWR